MHSLAFPKTRRLLNAAQVQRVFDQVDCKQGGRFFTLLSRSNHLERSRLGIVVAKRHVKTAVQRNAIKRRIRETFRIGTTDCAAGGAGFDVIVIAKPGCATLAQQQITAELNRQWAKLISKRAAMPGNCPPDRS